MGTIAVEDNLMESSCFDSNEGISPTKNLKSVSAQTTVSESDNDCFDCNICLDSATDPVVTLCGHLYCWPCIYRWLQVQNFSDEADEQKKCPVCKADISHTSLVPLYGRGTSNSNSKSKKLQMSLEIPHRPPPYSLNPMLTSASSSTSHPGQQFHPSYFQSQQHPFHNQQYFPQLYGGYAANGSSYLGVMAMASLFYPMIDMFSEMVFARIFGSSDPNLFSYRYINSSPHNATGSPRMRRQEMQVDKSLNRVSIFLLCCIILCLVLF